MQQELKAGLKHTQSMTVDESLTAPTASKAFAGFADTPPVFATAFLVGFTEWTCIEALKPYLAASANGRRSREPKSQCGDTGRDDCNGSRGIGPN
jgi:hypothetical protein